MSVNEEENDMAEDKVIYEVRDGIGYIIINNPEKMNSMDKESTDRLSAILDLIEDLHQLPEGRQLLTIFRVERQEHFHPSYLDGTNALIARHKALLESTHP